jgi:hypothetical protein
MIQHDLQLIMTLLLSTCVKLDLKLYNVAFSELFIQINEANY